MTTAQANAFIEAIEAAEVSNFVLSTDLSTHLKHDGKSSIIKISSDKECAVCFRANKSFGGSVKTFNSTIETVMADFADIHEAKVGVNSKQAKAFAESFGLDLSDDEFKILLQIDGANTDLNPVTGNYVDRFHYLSQKQYNELTEEEKEKYDAEKAAYEKKKNEYLPPHSAAQITV